jgi:GT2 family glycosyltransferase
MDSTYTSHPNSLKTPVPKVSIIVLNYMQWHDTIACVCSLQRCTYQNYEIVLIDNGSPNDSENQLRKQFPDLTFFQTGNNLGYTGGINYGIKKVLQGNPEFVLVINPDTTVEPSFLDHLVAGMVGNPNAAIVGGTIFHSNDKNKIWYAGGKLLPWRGLAHHFTSLVEGAVTPQEKFIRVTFVTGCLMLIRVSALNNIGLLDDRFFMYYDDIEYCSRAQRLGYILLYVPEAKILHNIVCVDKAVYKLYYSMRNRYLLIRTAFSGMQRWTAMIYFSISIIVKMINWRFVNVKYYQALRMGIEDYFAGRFGRGRGLEYVAEHQKKDSK